VGGIAPLICQNWLEDSGVGNPFARDFRMNATTRIATAITKNAMSTIFKTTGNTSTLQRGYTDGRHHRAHPDTLTVGGGSTRKATR
jgi:hypothetical protein